MEMGEVVQNSGDLARSDFQKIFVSRKQEQPRERQPSCVDAQAGWRMTEAAAFPSAETGREARGTTA